MAVALVAGIELAQGVRVINNPRQDGYHHLSNGDAVVPLRGHVLEMEFLKDEHRYAQLGTYFDFLPIVVTNPTFRPRLQPPPRDARSGGDARGGNGSGNGNGARSRAVTPTASGFMREYEVACMLLRSCKEVVHAGDADREGQRIVDELLEHMGIDPNGHYDSSGGAGADVKGSPGKPHPLNQRNRPVWRLPLISNRAQDIAAQLGQLELNGDPRWRRRGTEAMVRTVLDAATGLNGSMAMQDYTGIRNISVGRVQTPLLWLVRERDEQIAKFKGTTYWVPVITLADGTEMRWLRRQGAQGQPGFDAEGRIVDEALARAIVQGITRGLSGQVAANTSVRHSIAPALPFAAASLASTAAKRLGVPLVAANEAAQRLYDRHKAITYVGTDCSFLPTSLREQARTTITALARLMPGAAGATDLYIVSPAWNDAKVDKHFAIIPTGELPSGLSGVEAEIFSMVSRRYMAQFCPDHVVAAHKLEMTFAQDTFVALRREVVQAGWVQVEGSEEVLARDLPHIDDSLIDDLDAEAATHDAQANTQSGMRVVRG